MAKAAFPGERVDVTLRAWDTFGLESQHSQSVQVGEAVFNYYGAT